MQIDNFDEERSQDVENIMRTGDQDFEKNSFYDGSSMGGKKYYASLFHNFKYIIGLIFIVFFTISLTLAITLSGAEPNNIHNVQFETENLVEAEGITDSITGSAGKEKFNDVSRKPLGGLDESFTTGTASDIATGRTGNAGANENTQDSEMSDSSMEFLELLERSFSEMNFTDQHSLSFDSNISPQSQALLWMVQNDNKELSDERKVQRYALAAFFYSTYAVTHAYLSSQLPWKSANKWLSNFNECEWEGITCDGESITSIVLADNRISGTPPLDLGLLGSTLETLVLSSNMVHMEGSHLDVFGYLTNLKDLKLDDNYISTTSGLPESLQNLDNLERVVLSYNLLQGQIPSDYFANLRKLSHLEFESNYVTGPLPSSLLQSESLTYLYMRRNNIAIKFDEIIKSSNWPKIFSLWFDNNDITGTIPAEIGRLTGLASLSMSNTTLSGSIPAEIGELTGLKRLWLYNNKLSGQIPQELGEKIESLEVVELYGNDLTGEVPASLCTTIENSPYNFKELSADCDEVMCDCCTKCY